MIFTKSKVFVLVIFILLLFFTLLYIFIFDLSVSKKSTDPIRSYKYFLLNSTTPGNRIIIDSGSNSYHSIDSSMIEKEFNMTTINISDNASYPLKYKLKKIATYAKKGDIVLLPLEVGYYHYDDIPKIFYDHIFNVLNSYYLDLSLFDKIYLSLTTPLSSLLSHLLNNTNNFALNDLNNTGYIQMIKKFNEGQRGDSSSTKKVKIKDCGIYFKDMPFKISESFQKNIQQIKEIEKNKKVKFIFLPPAFILDSKLKNLLSPKIKAYFTKLFSYLEKNDLLFLEHFEDSIFNEKFLLDTCHHITPNARVIRTEKLIKNLKESKYSNYFKKRKQQPLVYKENKYIQFNKKYSFSSLTKNEFIMLDNWYKKEPWGVWSKKDINSLYFILNKEKIKNYLLITIDSRIFNTKDSTDIYINKKRIGTYVLDGITQIKIDKKYINNNLNYLKLINKNIKSPENLGISKDKRLIKIALKSISFKQY